MKKSMDNERGKRVVDPVVGDRISPRQLRERKRKRRERGESVANSGDGNAHAGVGAELGGTNSNVDANVIARDLARDAERAERERNANAAPSAENETSAPFVLNELTPPTPRRPRARRTSAMVDAQVTAATLIALVSGVGESLFGSRAAMTQTEQELILMPLTRMFARMESDTLSIVQTYADPATVLFGLGMWLVRVRQITTTKTPTAAPSNSSTPPNQTENVKTAAPSPEAEFIPGVNPRIAALFDSGIFQ